MIVCSVQVDYKFPRLNMSVISEFRLQVSLPFIQIVYEVPHQVVLIAVSNINVHRVAKGDEDVGVLIQIYVKQWGERCVGVERYSHFPSSHSIDTLIKFDFFSIFNLKRDIRFERIMDRGGINVDEEVEMNFTSNTLNVVVLRPDPQPTNTYQVHVERTVNHSFNFENDATGHALALRNAIETQLQHKMNILSDRLANVVNRLPDREDQHYAVFSTLKYLFDGEKIIREDANSGTIYYATLFLDSSNDNINTITDYLNVGQSQVRMRGFVFTTAVEGLVVRLKDEERYIQSGNQYFSSDEE
tara:strand:+ start:172 stop:1074 length:903 start_codon:yes stop_codon:yes gene_type:complete